MRLTHTQTISKIERDSFFDKTFGFGQFDYFCYDEFRNDEFMKQTISQCNKVVRSRYYLWKISLAINAVVFLFFFLGVIWFPFSVAIILFLKMSLVVLYIAAIIFVLCAFGGLFFIVLMLGFTVFVQVMLTFFYFDVTMKNICYKANSMYLNGEGLSLIF